MRKHLPLGILVVASFAFRVPALVNASGVNSDAAIVGLQAMHLLRGEHAVFLWGSGYQTSVDSYVAAAFFSLFGATPCVLVLSALTLHVLSTIFAYATVRRFLADAWLALVVVLPLVLSTAAIHSYALNPPRQASLTLAMAAIALAARRWWLGSGLLSMLALYADPYALLFVPAPVVMLALDRRRRTLRFFGGLVAGAIPVALRMHHPAAQHGIFSVSTDVIAHNAKLLWDPCGPWFLGTTIVHAPDWSHWRPWPAPLFFRVIQLAGGAAFFAVCALSLVFARRERAIVRAAAIVALSTLGGFLVSLMVMDAFSMRYLAAIAIVLPFLAISVARRLGRARFTMLFAPYVATSALSGWITLAPYTDGPRVVRERAASGAPEAELEERLAKYGVTHAIADYWAAYRITFVTQERLVVVPLHEKQDRHAEYRNAFERAARVAYVYDPLRSGEDESSTARELEASLLPIDHVSTGSFRAVIYARRSGLMHASK
jgi:hypothetical protein